MGNVLADRFWGMARRLFYDDESAVSTMEMDSEDMIKAVTEAKQEWLTAKSYFSNVTDPDLIDHAIFSVEAAERKYMYLLKRAKRRGVTLNQPYFYLEHV